MRSEIEATALYKKWFARLKDTQAKARIATRLNFIRGGHFGDHQELPGGISELRFAFGPGYRIYYTVQGCRVVLLLVGGDKSSQARHSARPRHAGKVEGGQSWINIRTAPLMSWASARKILK